MDTNFKNPNIEFDSYKHCYSINGVEHKSVTKIINTYLPDFDSAKWSAKKAAEEGIEPEEMREMWSIKANYSTVIGRDFHYYVTMFLKYGKAVVPVTNCLDNRIREFHKFWAHIRRKIDIIEVELKVAHKDYAVAGTIDCLCRNTETNTYFIMDWKTNQHIKFKNDYGSIFSSPLSHLDNCEYNKYCLQIAFYKEILESSFNIELNDGCMVHFPEIREYRIIPAKNMDLEVKTILNSFLKKDKLCST